MAVRLPRAAASGDAAPQAPSALRWPTLALLSWAACFAVWRLFGPDWPAALVASGLGLILAGLHRQVWRRLIVAAGFPLALLVTSSSLPAWAWLIPLAVLLLAYPRRGWTDAPLFPTPHDALRALPGQVALRDSARVLDAGSGLGDGLVALRRAYPGVRVTGIEYSGFLWLLARLRCPWAEIARGDLWAQSWRDTDLVYLFQRPESMPRALDKARAEMRPGSWLVSLDFPLPGPPVHARLETGTRHQLYVYRVRDLGA
ncbi:hypothetical protein CDN99_08950 [Roseateles aquatilis]|uniref:Methyltransferase type 12 n=1 Tax=Roseateles aquatilis TaxID=431061 RepID=A0A246JFA4_9BURK|nr:methyltransferase type 12 [Roseateles aquatilis]OWQ91295.1 hypothetical protein CDN99_08950 [Roseateles aquatilis]